MNLLELCRGNDYVYTNSMNRDIDWEIVCKAREDLENFILSKIRSDITMKINTFLMEENEFVRRNSELFGYDSKKVTTEDIVSEITEYLNNLVSLRIIKTFRLGGFDERFRNIELYLYLYDGSRCVAESFWLDRYRW